MTDFKERLAESQAKLREAKAKFDDTVETAQIAGMLAKDKLDDQISSVKGDINAGAENARLKAEEGKGKFNAALLKAQMTLEQAKSAIAEKKVEFNKSVQEDRILDLLEYADECEEMAVRFAVEAELAILEAAAEVADYEEKYNK